MGEEKLEEKRHLDRYDKVRVGVKTGIFLIDPIPPQHPTPPGLIQKGNALPLTLPLEAEVREEWRKLDQNWRNETSSPLSHHLLLHLFLMMVDQLYINCQSDFRDTFFELDYYIYIIIIIMMPNFFLTNINICSFIKTCFCIPYSPQSLMWTITPTRHRLLIL